jgi:hypothetical protein
VTGPREPAASAYRRRRGDVATLLAAAALAALCSWAVASGDVGPVEQAVFAWVNQWPDWLAPYVRRRWLALLVVLAQSSVAGCSSAPTHRWTSWAAPPWGWRSARL